MESSLRSRKRKQRPLESDPSDGMFTRSRSQIYFHRHRSGNARSDSNRNSDLFESLQGTANSLVKQKQSESTFDQIADQVSVKDLRARRVFSSATIENDALSIGKADSEADFVVNLNDAHVNVPVSEDDAGCGDSVVSGPAAINLQASLKSTVDSSTVREKDVMKHDVVVQMTPTTAEAEQSKRPGEKHEMVTVANGTADTTGNNISSVTSWRGRRKLFKSPSSFSFGRLLPYLMDSWNDGSSSFEIVEATLPKVVKSSNTVSDTVGYKDELITPVANSTNLTESSLNDAKSCEKQFPDSMNNGAISTVEGSDVVHNKEDVLNDRLEECVQTTPPDNISGVLVKPTPKPALKSCSRKALLQTPTSFSHRRLLPFLLSVAGDDSCMESSKLESATEQNQQPQEQFLLPQKEKSIAADELSNSPTSTLVPVDTSPEKTKSVTLVSDENTLDANGPDNKDSRSILQLEVNSQGEVVKSDSCLMLEQSPLNINLQCVEETTSKATPFCTDQSCREDNQISVNESQHQNSLQISETHVESIKSGILKRTPRGCRGICNCLNCTSFRLHAERSFEFSRNQMIDAEEVALELINDLTCLRNMLETTCSDSNSLDTDKQKQVKEACEKALYKEQVARARLEQMNEDLNFHCRSMNSLRPKVTFANRIED